MKKHKYPRYVREKPRVAEIEIKKEKAWLTGGVETIDDGEPKKAPLLESE